MTPISTTGAPVRFGGGTFAQTVEDRRHTRSLTQREYDYLLRAVRVPGCHDADLRQQVIVDAILYFMDPVTTCVPPALVDEGRGLGYYLGVKATHLYVDECRRRGAAKRGGGVADLSLDHTTADGWSQSLQVADPTSSEPGLDAARLRAGVFAALAATPDKLRIFELHLQGLSPTDITLALGWAVEVNGKVASGRVRKALHDALVLVQKKLPGLAALRLGPGGHWGENESENRAPRHVSALDCEAAALRLEGCPVSTRDRRRLGLCDTGNALAA